MTGADRAALVAFAERVGWRPTPFAAVGYQVDEAVDRLRKLSDLFGRSATWSADGFAKLEYEENNEPYFAVFRTFIDGDVIWRIYERLHPVPDRPNYNIARRSPDLIWAGMGFFDVWPPNWTKVGEKR